MTTMFEKFFKLEEVRVVEYDKYANITLVDGAEIKLNIYLNYEMPNDIIDKVITYIVLNRHKLFKKLRKSSTIDIEFTYLISSKKIRCNVSHRDDKIEIELDPNNPDELINTIDQVISEVHIFNSI